MVLIPNLAAGWLALGVMIPMAAGRRYRRRCSNSFRRRTRSRRGSARQSSFFTKEWRPSEITLVK
jgi:hypothetical protein